ncbi:MAG: PAS domain-containing protein [Nitrospirota bacterium]
MMFGKKTQIIGDKITETYTLPLRLLALSVIALFVVETFIMFLLAQFMSLLPPYLEAILDALILTGFGTLILYLSLFRPMNRQIYEREKAEETAKNAYTEVNQIFQTAADGMRIVDWDFNILRENKTFKALSGYENAVGRKCFEVFSGLQCNTDMCSLKRILDGEERIKFESVREDKDGKKIPCIITAMPFRSCDGELIGIVEDFKDITERKQSEEALKKNQEKLNAMLQSIGDHMSMLDRDLNIIWANDVAKKIFGDNIIGRKCYEVYHRRMEPCEPYPCLTLKAFRDGKVHEHETTVINKDHKIIHFHCTANVALRDEEGNPTAVIEISRDISTRKEMEEALKKSEEEKRIILDTISERLSYRDIDMRIQWANRAFIESTGLPADEIIGKHCYEVMQKRSDPCPECPMHVRIVETGHSQEAELATPDGKIWAVQGYPMRDISGKIIGTLEISADISARKKAEKEIEKLKKQIEFILGVTKTGLDIIDPEFNIIYIDPEWKKIYGDPAGKKCYEYFMGRQEICPGCGIPKALETKSIVVTEEILIKEGNRPIQVTTMPFQDENGRWLCAEVNVDISERKKMEDERLKFEKLESLGILAGGIAHDFNNILTAIVGNISFAKMSLDSQNEVYKALIMAEKASLRAKDLTQQLLAFSRGGEPIKKVVSVSELIKDSANFVSSGSSVKCEFFLADDLLPVEVDEGQMNQVFNNLLINAIQSMPQGGVISISAENLSDTDPLALHDGKYVKITIRDYGHGIPQEYLKKIFDPYFTTKQKGSGLGLATAYYIIKRHHGHIRAESKLGAGSAFYVYLPASEKHIVAGQEAVEILPAKGKILVMDDEEILREFTNRMLTRLGYEVEVASDGTEAIELFLRAKDSGKPFDVVLMDLTIPGGMGGKEAIKKLREIDLEVKAIVSSGYSNDPIMANYREYGFKSVVTKPYTLEVLSKTLSDVLLGKG